MKRIYILAAIVSILTGISVFYYASYLENAAKSNFQPVVVASVQIQENTMVTSEMLSVKQLPVEAINSLTVRKISDAIGKVAIQLIETNEQILSTKLNEKGKVKGGLEYLVPDGKRAITIAVDDKSGVAGYIKKGNHVDVVASLMIDAITEKGKTKVPASMFSLQNIEVIATGISSASASTDGKPSSYATVTLAVTPEEALRLDYCVSEGKVRLILRPVLDNGINTILPYAPAS